MNIAIIGAGLAGITVANRLSAMGLNVDVFEKSRGLGGRLASKRLDWGTIDIGAQYFTARDTRFQHEVKKWIEHDACALWDFAPFSVKDANLIPSGDNIERYVGLPYMNQIAHSLKGDFRLIFESRAEQVIHSEKGYKLKLDCGAITDDFYDWLVVTAPAEQSKELLKFHRLSESIAETVHEPCWALALATKGKVDNKIQGIFGDNLVSWVSRLSSRPSFTKSNDYDDCWMLHFSSEWSTVSGKSVKNDIHQIGFDWLTGLLVRYCNTDLSLMNNYSHYWRFARTINRENSQSFLLDDSSQIAVVGDWLNGGRVEGAFLSALEFTDHFSNIYNNKFQK